ncbi:MAG: SDR family oxidoreductase [Actinomycetota bacterium]|nr:SDR family oxidoreductase [Actinomycetota bacterium]
MDLQLAGKRAIVTGASRGIGKAVAASLLAEGASVAVVARHTEPLEDAARELGGRGGHVIPLVADTGDDDAVHTMVAAAVAALGGIDILVNNAATAAGQSRPPKVLELGTDALLAEINVKVMGYIRTIREVAPHLMAAGGGRIVNVDGLGSRLTGSVATSIRNAGVVALTKNAADELGAHGIGVTAVSPGLVRTEATPGVLEARAAESGASAEEVEAQIGSTYAIGRMVTAAEVATVVTWLASPLSVAITGDTIPCGGGVRGAIYY